MSMVASESGGRRREVRRVRARLRRVADEVVRLGRGVGRPRLAGEEDLQLRGWLDELPLDDDDFATV